jgi:hypothetical protein
LLDDFQDVVERTDGSSSEKGSHLQIAWAPRNGREGVGRGLGNEWRARGGGVATFAGQRRSYPVTAALCEATCRTRRGTTSLPRTRQRRNLGSHQQRSRGRCQPLSGSPAVFRSLSTGLTVRLGIPVGLYCVRIEGLQQFGRWTRALPPLRSTARMHQVPGAGWSAAIGQRLSLEQAEVGRGGPNWFVQHQLRHLHCFAQPLVLQTACHPATWRAIPCPVRSASAVVWPTCRRTRRKSSSKQQDCHGLLTPVIDTRVCRQMPPISQK